MSGAVQPTLISAITAAGLTSGLLLCLDAGDANSYTSGTKWLDTSGNGYDFFLGTNGTTYAPSFVGPAGSRNAYWANGSPTMFRYDTTNEVWMQNIHKNNAVFTMLQIYYPNTSADVYNLNGTTGSIGGTGFYWGALPALNLEVKNAGSSVLSKTSATIPSDNDFHIVAVSVNEATGAGGGFFYLDGNYSQVSGGNTWNSTYTSPSSGNATYTMEIESIGNAETPPGAYSRLACYAVWSVALTKADLDALKLQLRGRYGL